MKLVFFGTSEFAVPTLRRLAPSIVLVVSQPDRPSGRGLKLRPSPVRAAALELGLPVETPEKSRAPEFVERLRALDVDAHVVAAYGQILSQATLDSARRGGINLHGSVLPQWRGAAPIQRAILASDLETGVSLMQMDRGMDTGDVIAIARTHIDPDETYGDLQTRLADIAADLAESWMPQIVSGEYPRTSQDSAVATLAPKVTKDEAELRFEMTSEEAYRRFRAFTPSPGAFFSTRFGLIRVRSACLGSSKGEPGRLVSADEIALATGSLRLLQIQPAGKPAMPLRDFANGHHLATGADFRS